MQEMFRNIMPQERARRPLETRSPHEGDTICFDRRNTFMTACSVRDISIPCEVSSWINQQSSQVIFLSQVFERGECDLQLSFISFGGYGRGEAVRGKGAGHPATTGIERPRRPCEGEGQGTPTGRRPETRPSAETARSNKAERTPGQPGKDA